MNKFEFKQKSVSIEEKNDFNAKVINTFLDVIDKYGRLSSFNSEFIRKDLAKGLYEVATDLFSEVDTILMSRFNVAKEILEGEFAVSSDCSLPLFAILDTILLCCKATNVPLEEMERTVKLTRRFNNSKEINSNWHINPEILSCLGNNSKISFEKFAKKASYTHNDKVDKRNSTILTYNDLYLRDGDFSNEGDISIINAEDEKVFGSNIDRCGELSCNDIFTLNAKDGNQENRKPLFKEQAEELDKKYVFLYNRILSKKMESLYAKFRNHVIPYFKDDMLKESALIDSIPWNDNEDLLSLARSLERVFILINTYCSNNRVSVRASFNDYNFLNAISIEMYDLCILEKKAKNMVIKNIIEIVNAKSPIVKKIFKINNISGDFLEQELNHLPLANLCYIHKKLSEKIFGCKELKKIMRYKKA